MAMLQIIEALELRSENAKAPEPFKIKRCYDELLQGMVDHRHPFRVLPAVRFETVGYARTFSKLGLREKDTVPACEVASFIPGDLANCEPDLVYLSLHALKVSSFQPQPLSGSACECTKSLPICWNFARECS